MSKRIPLTIQKHSTILTLIHSVSNLCTRFKSELESLNPSWNNKTDGRILLYLFIREASQSYFLSQALSKSLNAPNWWIENNLGNSLTGIQIKDDKFISDRLYHYNESIKLGFFIIIYHEFESFFRLITENYDGGSCSNYNIGQTVTNLFSKLNFGQEFLNIWKIYAYSRNTIHSNGFHTKESTTITHKNKTFEFKQNHPICFLDLNNIIYIISECLFVTNNVINHKDIKVISEITHKASEVKFE